MALDRGGFGVGKVRRARGVFPHLWTGGRGLSLVRGGGAYISGPRLQALVSSCIYLSFSEMLVEFEAYILNCLAAS